MQKGAKGKSRVLTANRLRDGLAVFLAAGGGWVADIHRAQVAIDAEAMAALEAEGRAAEAAQHVVGAYLIDVAAEDGKIRPLRNREQIRAAGGPTVPGAVADPGAGRIRAA
ncbi:MAG: DUF2849 domain-containing protein [Sneathiellaceae bacterium]